jgi:hypothetical protein
VSVCVNFWWVSHRLRDVRTSVWCGLMCLINTCSVCVCVCVCVWGTLLTAASCLPVCWSPCTTGAQVRDASFALMCHQSLPLETRQSTPRTTCTRYTHTRYTPFTHFKDAHRDIDRLYTHMQDTHTHTQGVHARVSTHAPLPGRHAHT